MRRAGVAAEAVAGELEDDRVVHDAIAAAVVIGSLKILFHCENEVVAIAEELHAETENLGSSTFRRVDLERGFEPDSCFYIQNAEAVRGKARLDLTVDPPPDLVIEIDITSPSIKKASIYAQIGVPEVWRYDGTAFRIKKMIFAYPTVFVRPNCCEQAATWKPEYFRSSFRHDDSEQCFTPCSRFSVRNDKVVRRRAQAG